MEYYLDGMTNAELNLYKHLKKYENENFIVLPNFNDRKKRIGY